MDKYELVKFKNDNVELDVNVDYKDNTVWLSQDQIVALFQSSKSNVSEHIKHIFEDGELEENSTVRNFRIVQKEAGRSISRNIKHYNLDMIISIGYRVNSKQGIAFRQWANKVLKEYLLRGYVINENRTLITNENYLNLVNKVESMDKRIEVLEGRKQYLIQDGQIYEGYELLTNIIKEAKESIILIDPYADTYALNILKNSNVNKYIITSPKCNISDKDIEIFNKQYKNSSLKKKRQVS